MIIDTHVHFWRYTREEFGWIGDDMAAIRKDFLPDADSEPIWDDEVIAVQARQSMEETNWLCGLARQYGFIAGVVGWLPLVSPDIEKLLEERDPKLVGVRHVLQAEPPAFFADAAFNNGLAALAKAGLSYDLLVTEPQLPETIQLVDRHPGLRFIVDHLAKPVLDDGPSVAWRRDMLDLGRRPNVYCKLSGGITEAKLDWNEQEMTHFFDVALWAFGPRRLLYGSNWPVSEATGGHERWSSAVWGWAVPILSDRHSEGLEGYNALAAYRLGKA